MTAGQAVVLGLVQGLTEFLPVSSSGHLVICQRLLGITTPGVLFEALVHFGTLLAVVWAFRADIAGLLRRPWQKMAVLIVVGTIPTAVMGVFFGPLFRAAFDSVAVVGGALIVTGLLLWWSGRLTPGRKEVATTSVWDALAVGFGQGLAITPGLSRSGTTIAFALLRGLEPRTAARYSFLLSVPAILGANLWEAKDLLESGPTAAVGMGPGYWLAAAAAAVSGYAAIRFFLGVLQRGRLHWFAFYCWFVGLATLVVAAGGR